MRTDTCQCPGALVLHLAGACPPDTGGEKVKELGTYVQLETIKPLHISE